MPTFRDRPTILLTGFGPFPTVPVNASWAVVQKLAPAAAQAFPGYRIHHEMLSTEWFGGTQRIVQLIDATRPVLALHFGVSSRATGFVIEARGYNERSVVADACGHTPEAADCLVDGGPDHLTARLPLNLIVNRLRAKALPVELSRDAGRYLCNAALYHSLDTVRRYERNIRSGFIHLPTIINERRHAGGSKLTMTQAVDGGLEIIGASLGERAVARIAPRLALHRNRIFT
jgi:pyroglutamyl-peptidase